MYKKIILILFIFALILIPYSFSLDNINETHAETTVNYQIIDEDTVWTLEGSPFLIYLDDIIVSEGATLIIEPGVIVKLDRMSINVEGILDVQGDEDNPVIFTSLNNDEAGGKSVPWSSGNPQAGDWGAIKVKEGGQITMNNSIVSYGGEEDIVPMLVKRIIKPNIVKAQFGFEIGVISTWSNTETIINNTKIINNVIGLELGGNVQINNSQISGNMVGLMLFADQAVIHDSEIYNNIFDGLVNFETNQVDATNNWWGDDSGPYHETLNPEGKGDRVSDNVLFDPWTQKNETKRNPVIIVPGIIASYLYDVESEDEIWLNLGEMFLSGNDIYLNDLILPRSGVINMLDVYPEDILRSINIPLFGEFDFFQGLITELENNGYEEGVDLFVFPYDWRLDIDYISGHGAGNNPNTLANKIQDVISQTNSQKVDIIAHSMGGLVVKNYAKVFGTSTIDKFIDIATPHLGSPDSFKALMYGDDLGMNLFGFGLNQQRMQIISQNMPSIYQLLPSRKYFDYYQNYVADIHDIDENEIKGNLNYDQTTEFLVNMGRNPFFLNVQNINDELHGRIDNLEIPNSYNIIGKGEATIGKIYVLNKEKSGGYEYGLKYINGDGTVPFLSAENFSNNKIYTTGTTHAYLSSFDGVRDVVISILNNNIGDFDFSQFDNLSLNRDDFELNGTQISFHSPIEMHIYDNEGNHVGPSENGDIEINIPGVKYDIIEGNKFAFLPKGKEYTIAGKAEDQGTFNARIEIIENNNYTKKAYFNEIQLTSTSTNVKFTIQDDQEEYLIDMDKDGDGIFEQEIEPSSILQGEEMDDYTKPTTTIEITGIKGINDYYVSDIEIELTAQDDNTGILNIEYSLDNGQTWNNYENKIIITEDGEHKTIYSSTDRAGNREVNKEKTIKIDKINPEILILTPTEINRNEILSIEYIIDDNYSGTATDTIEIYFDNKRVINTEIDLFYKNLGEYQIKIIAKDNAGNKTEEIVGINIIIDVNGIIFDIERSYQEDLVNKKAKDRLIKDLNNIQKYSKRHGERIEKRDERQEKIMEKCIEKRGEEFCKEKLDKIFNKIDYSLNKIHQKILKIKYSLILRRLKIYKKLKSLFSLKDEPEMVKLFQLSI